MTTNEPNYKKKNDNDNLKKKICKKGQIVQLNSQPIKYEYTKMDKKNDNKNHSSQSELA